MNKEPKPFFPLLILFIILNGFFLTGNKFLAKWGLDSDILVIANAILFVLSLLTFLLQKKALNNKNPNVFIRSVMGGTMIKMGVCAAAILIYVLLNRNSVDKKSIFAAMILYLIYLFVEVRVLLKLNTQKNVQS